MKCTGFADRKSGRKAIIERMRRDEEQHRGRRGIADRAVRDPRGGSRRLGHSLVLSAVHLTIICVLVDAPFRCVFCRGRHLKPFLRLEYVIPRDDTVHASAQAQAYTGGGQQHAGQRRPVGQGNMDVIRRPSSVDRQEPSLDERARRATSRP